jgi:phosphonate transport system permease protein
MVVVIVISVELLSSRIRARLRPGESQDTSIVDAVKGLFDGDKWLGRGDPKN